MKLKMRSNKYRRQLAKNYPAIVMLKMSQNNTLYYDFKGDIVNYDAKNEVK